MLGELTAEHRTRLELIWADGKYHNHHLDGWLVHSTDTANVPGVTVRSVPLLMTDPATTAEMVRAAMTLGGVEL